MRYAFYLLPAFLLLGCGPGDHMNDSMDETTVVTTVNDTLYYGDIINNDVIGLDLKLMQQVQTISMRRVISSRSINSLPKVQCTM